MKDLTNLYIISSLFVIFVFSSCSPEENIITDPSIQQSIDVVVTKWGVSKVEVSNHMEGFVKDNPSSDKYLQFSTHEGNTTFIYKFSNEKLSAVAIKTKVGQDGNEITPPGRYAWVGAIDDDEIYEDAANNVFLVKHDIEASGDNVDKYRILGFTPLLSITEKVNNKECVDLGISKKWATCNVGANLPEESGDYFSWGETSPKDSYSWSTYNYCNGTSSTVQDIDKSICGTEYDVAKKKYGNTWCLPTTDDLKELRLKCDWVWTTENNIKGYKVFGENGNYIFLPAAGYKTTSINYGGSYGYYSSGIVSSTSTKAYVLKFDNDSKSSTTDYRYIGFPIRPVCQ